MSTATKKRPRATWLLLAMVLLFLGWDLWAVLLDRRLSGADAFTRDTLNLLRLSELGVGEWLRGVGPKGPLVPALALPLVWLLDSLPQATRLVPVAAHAALVFQAHDLGRRLGGSARAGLWSALLCGGAPMIVGWARLDYRDLVLASAVMLVLQLVLRQDRLDRLRPALLLGCALGAALMVKAAVLLFLVVPAAWLLWHNLRSLRAAVYLLAALVVTALLISPWAVANREVFLHYIADSSQDRAPFWQSAGHYLALPGVAPLLLAAAAGTAGLWRDRRVIVLAGTVLLSLILLCGLFPTWSRYLLPLIPPAAVLAGAGLARLQQRFVMLGSKPMTWGLAVLPLALFVGLNLIPLATERNREWGAGLLWPDSRPHQGLVRALAALGPRPLPVLLVCSSGEAFSRFQGSQEILSHRGQTLRQIDLRGIRQDLAPGSPLGVLLVKARRGTRSWNVEAAHDPVRDEHRGRLRWLQKQRIQPLISVRDPDGVEFEAYRTRSTQ